MHRASGLPIWHPAASLFVTGGPAQAYHPRMRNILCLAAVLAAALLSGCARARVTTEIRPDGSFNRTVLLSGAEKKEGQMAPSIDDTFLFPSGPGWKMTDGKEKSDVTKTFVRTVAAGGSLKGDLGVKAEKTSTAPELMNEVTITRVGPKTFEYKETLRWTGPPPKEPLVKDEDLAGIKAALPKDLATDANARAVANRTAALVLPMMFGPNDLLLAVSLVHPDLAERRAHQRIGTVLLQALQDQFGDKMTADQRRQVASKLIESSFSSSRPSQPDPSGGGESKNSSGFTPITFIVRAPGKLVSSNGEFDELSGEVYWALFPEAASLKPIVLTATYELP